VGFGDYAKYGSLGISLAVTTAIYLFLGYRGGLWLDQRLGTEPVFLLLGIVLGMVLSLVSFAKEILALARDRRGMPSREGDNGGGFREKEHVRKLAGTGRPKTSRGKEEGE